MVPIKLDGRSVYGVVTADGTGIRVRVTLDEWDQLGLLPGRQVRVETPGHGQTLLLAAADQAPPFVFLRLVPLAARVAS